TLLTQPNGGSSVASPWCFGGGWCATRSTTSVANAPRESPYRRPEPGGLSARKSRLHRRKIGLRKPAVRADVQSGKAPCARWRSVRGSGARQVLLEGR